MESGTVNTKDGALLTSKNALDVLKQREQQKAVSEEFRASRVVDAEEKRAQRSKDMMEKAATKEGAE